MSEEFTSEDLKKDVDFVSKQVSDLNKTMVGVVLVLFLGFITLLTSFLTLIFEVSGVRTEATNNLTEEIRILSNKIEPDEKTQVIISKPAE